MSKRIQLSMWAERRYEKPPSSRTLRRWAVSGNIIPRPQKEGRSFWVEAHAEYIDTTDPDYLENVARVLNT